MKHSRTVGSQCVKINLNENVVPTSISTAAELAVSGQSAPGHFAPGPGLLKYFSCQLAARGISILGRKNKLL